MNFFHQEGSLKEEGEAAKVVRESLENNSSDSEVVKVFRKRLMFYNTVNFRI
jgi:hypothetical protein